MNARRPLLCACAALVLWACDSDRVAGGSVETENISARILPVDSFLPEWNRPDSGSTVGTLRFDSANFDFSRTSSDGRDLRLERMDSTLLPFEVVFWDKTARQGRLRVRLADSLLACGAQVRLRWGGGNASTLSDPTATWAGIGDSARQALASVMVADFENGNDTTLLPTHPVWTRIAYESASIDSFGYPAAGGNRSGKAFSMSYRTTGRQYVLIKTPLVAGGAPRSLRALDSMVLWARGSGVVFVALEHADADTNFKAWKEVHLDTAWTRLRIRPQDFDTTYGIGGNRGWIAVRDSVTDIALIASAGTRLWVDDIRLHGIDRDDAR